jgi:hypothetical protein
MMDERMIAALAKGVAPFVRECVAEAIAKVPPVSLPPELAEQVASAARLLHELPPIERSATSTRVTRIERDESGAFVPIYDETPTP